MPDATRIVCTHCGAVNRMPPDREALAAKCGDCHKKLFGGHPAEVDAAGLERHLRSGDIPVLLDIWAPWCGPCRAMAPMFERAATVLEPAARLLKLNADTAPEVMSRYGIRGIPTLVLFDCGQVVDKKAGLMDAAGIVQWAKSRLAGAHADVK